MHVEHETRSDGHEAESGDETDSAVDAFAPALAQLVALGREEHVTRAAASLGVPQPTLSRALARWEARVGVPLAVRTGRGLTLTRAGRTLVDAADVARTGLGAAVRGVREDAGLQRGRLVFAFLHTMGPDVVPRLVQEVLRRHPGVRVELRQDAHAVMLADLRRGEVDLVLTAPAPADRTGLDVTVLDTQPLVLTLPPGHRLAGRPRLSLAEVGEEPWVVLAPRYGMRTITDALWEAAGVAPPIAFEGQDVSTLRGLAAVGLGVALLPEQPGARDVVQVPLDPPAHREIALVAPADRPLGAVSAAFRAVALGFRGRLVRPG